MKIVQINTFPYKASGNIMMQIHQKLLEYGYNSYVVWGRGRNSQNKNEISLIDNLSVKFHGAYTRLTDKTGFASKRITRELIGKLEAIRPDLIHLHNIHGYYVNIELLFDYIKKNNKKIIWTLHDCWAFTGHCVYFDMIKCSKWETGCYRCEQKNTYPKSLLLDLSSWNWKKKKELFSENNMRIVVPSEWLKSIVKHSFLRLNPIDVIYNGVDTDTFKIRTSKIRDELNLKSFCIILGVASEWTERKGLIDFLKLGKMLNQHEFKIVLVGLTKRQIKSLPDNIIGIPRTENIQELVEIYNTADYFFNPTYEDNFPTTNLEAIACGTPVITYNTGGSPESLKYSKGCYVLEQGDIVSVVKILQKHKKGIKQTLNIQFDNKTMVQKYIKLYEDFV